MNRQHTIKREISFHGVGLHTGKRVRLDLIPARENHGIQFFRSDISSSEPIRANIHNVTSTTRATSISNATARVTTVEHLLSALFALGIDNLLCRINAEEVPVLDGSSAPFIAAIKNVGLQRQKAFKRFLRVLSPVEIQDGEKRARISPANEFRIECSIDFNHPVIGSQYFEYSRLSDFEKEIAPSRTFGFLSDVERMRAMGLALGGSLENTVVLDGDTILNPEGLRFKDEFVRHKVLDALGDISLCEHSILGRIELHKAGHEMQTRLIRELLAQPNSYVLITPLTEAEMEEKVLSQSVYA